MPKHKKSVGRIPRGAERGQTRLLNFSKNKWKLKEKQRVLKRHLRTISMETFHEFQVTCQQTQVSVSHTWAPTSKRLIRKGLQTIMFRQRNQGSRFEKSYRLHKHTRLMKGHKYIQNMPEKNQTTLNALSADKRIVSHQSHTMGSERRPNQCKYWNLRPVVIPECSLIATRNSHAKHKKSVRRIPEVRKRDTEVMYAGECRQKGHFFLNFLTNWSVESTNAAHTKIQLESKS